MSSNEATGERTRPALSDRQAAWLRAEACRAHAEGRVRLADALLKLSRAGQLDSAEANLLTEQLSAARGPEIARYVLDLCDRIRAREDG